MRFIPLPAHIISQRFLQRTRQIVLALACVLPCTACFTPALWDRTLSRSQDETRRESFEVLAVGAAGDEELALKTSLRGLAASLLLREAPLADPHSFYVITEAQPLTCTIRLLLEDQEEVEGSAKILVSGVLKDAIRRLPARPEGDCIEWGSPLTSFDTAHLLRLLSDETVALHDEPKPGNWLLDGMPVSSPEVIFAAFGTDGGPPDFDSLRRLEFWLQTSDGVTASWYALPADAVWLFKNCGCRRTDEGLLWTHQSTASVVAGSDAADASSWVVLDRPWPGEVLWRKRADRILPMTAAVIATPFAVAGDLLLVVGTAGLVFLLVYDGS